MDRLAVCFVPLSRVIGRTNQRPRIAVYKTARQRLITQFIELLRCPVLLNGKMRPGRLEILSEIYDRHVLLSEIVKGLEYLLAALPQTEHKARFYRGFRRPEVGEQFQYLERSVVAASRPNLFGKSSHRFQVVADDLRFCGEHRFDTLARTKKITGKKFDRTFRSGTPDREYRLRKNLRAAVLEIVAIDHRNNNVAKSHPGHRIRYPFGLAGIDRAG